MARHLQRSLHIINRPAGKQKMSQRTTALFARFPRGLAFALLRSGALIRCYTPFVQKPLGMEYRFNAYIVSEHG